MLKLTIKGPDALAPSLQEINEPGGQVWRNPDGTIWTCGFTRNGRYWMHIPNLASFCFGSGKDEVTAFVRTNVPSELIEDTYRRNVLPMVVQALGQEVLHASAVLTRHGVVALCAESKTGKSTVAFGLHQRGYQLWADDAVAIDTSNSHVHSIPLPFRLRLRPDARVFFGLDHPSLLPPKNPTDIDHQTMPLVALVVLKQVSAVTDGSGVEMIQLLSTQAFLSVLTHAYCFSLEDVKRKYRMMLQYLGLVARVPVFEIRFQTGLERLSAVLDSIEKVIEKRDFVI